MQDTKDEIEIVEEEVFEDESAKEEFEKVLEQYQAQGVDTSQVQVPNFDLYNCKIKRIKKTGRVKIESIPPEEFLIDRSAKTIEDANFVSHKVLMTRSDLVAMGYSQEEVDELPKSDLDIYDNEENVRTRDIDNYSINNPTDTSTEKVLVYESYVKYEF